LATTKAFELAQLSALTDVTALDTTLSDELVIDAGSLTLDGGRNLQWGGAFGSGFPAMWGHSANKQIKFAPDGNTSGLLYQMTATQLEVNPTTTSTTSTSGALVVAGGAGIAENLNVGGNIVVSGNLTVEGTSVTLNTTDLNVEDKNITLNYHASNDTSASAGGAGITIQDAVDSTTDASILWDATGDKFDFSHTVNVTGNLVSDGLTVDGHTTFNTASTLFANLNYGGANRGRLTTDGIDIKIEATSNLQFIANSVLSTKINGTGDVSFYEDNDSANGGTPAVGMHWDYADGRLGIGGSSICTNPQWELVVGSGVTGGTNGQIFVDATIDGTGDGITIDGDGRSTGDGSLFLIIDKDNNVGMDVGTDGNVGIGTGSSTTAKLQINTQIGSSGGSASTVDYPLVISQEDVGNTVDQGIGAGVGILFKNATNSSSEIGSAIASMRASASDSNTSNELAFFISDNDTTLDEAVRIDVNGNVGIGTDDPDCALDVTRTSGWAEMHLDGASGGDLILKDNGVSYGEVYAGNGHGLVIKSYASQDIYFLTDANATPKMVIESGGNVGIGVDPALHKLDVDGAIATRQVRHPVRPTLNLDFTNSKSLDSRFTFFRPSTATYTDSHGTIRYASHNTPRYDWDPLTGECLGLLIEEETINHCSASIPGSGHGQFSSHLDSYPAQTLAPDGTMSGVLLVEQSTEQQLMYASIGTVGVGTKWTWSIYIKAGHANADSLYMTSYGESVNATFNPHNGTSSGHSSRVMTDVGNGWYRCQLTFTKTNATGTFYIGFSGSTRAPDHQNRQYIWGAQIENKDFSTSFIPTLEKFTSRTSNGTYHDSTGQLVTAHDGEARYSHRWNGAEWIPTGLLREKSSTHLDGGDNVVLSNWGPNNCTLNGTTATTAPDGSFTAQKYVETGSGSIIHRLAGPNFSTTDQTTVSVYLKDDGSDTNVFVNAGATLGISMLVKPSAGTILDTHEGSGTVGWFGVEYAGNGWWRYYMGADGINATNRVYIGSVDDDHGSSGDDYYVADGTSGFYVWGYQRENERMMTSFMYSRWMGSTTRAADVVNFETYTRQPDNLDMYNAKELIGQVQGTVFSEWATKEPSTGYAGVFELQDEILGYTGIPSNGIDQRSNAFYMTGNYSVTYPTPAQNTFTKTAFAYDGTSVLDSRAAKDGALANTNTVHTWNMKLTRISIGRIDINNAYILNGHIKKFRLYTDRLSDDTLKALTEND
jgi:hypothetical protein